MLCQMEKFLDTHLRTGAFNAEHRFLYNLPIFKNDAQIAFASLENNIFQHDLENDSSLFINPIYRILKMYQQQANDRNSKRNIHLACPTTQNNSGWMIRLMELQLSSFTLTLNQLSLAPKRLKLKLLSLVRSVLTSVWKCSSFETLIH